MRDVTIHRFKCVDPGFGGVLKLLASVAFSSKYGKPTYKLSNNFFFFKIVLRNFAVIMEEPLVAHLPAQSCGAVRVERL